MAEEGFRRKLTTILSTDAVNFSRLMGEDEEATVRTSEACPEVLNTFIQEHNGQVLDAPGDNLRTIKAQRRSGWRVLSGCNRFQGSRPCSGGCLGLDFRKPTGQSRDQVRGAEPDDRDWHARLGEGVLERAQMRRTSIRRHNYATKPLI